MLALMSGQTSFKEFRKFSQMAKTVGNYHSLFCLSCLGLVHSNILVSLFLKCIFYGKSLTAFKSVFILSKLQTFMVFVTVLSWPETPTSSV